MTLFDVVTRAVADFSERGYISPEQLAYWIKQIRLVARESLTPPHKMAETLNRSLGAIYERLIDKGQIIKQHEGVSRFTLERVKPHLRAELNRRMMASADLIKLNRDEAIEKTIRRFSGWATSIPVGGSNAVDKNDVKIEVRKSMTQLPFAERRVLIDQGHKFSANLSDMLATDAGAIALVWHSNWRQPGYNYRPDHKERDGKIYTIRGNWAIERGLMKKGEAGYYDEVTACAEEPFCRCKARFIYALGKLPADMLTAKGRAQLQWARDQIERAA